MEENLKKKIEEFTKDIGEIRSIFTDNEGNYAVSFKGTSETMAVFDDSFNIMEFCSFYDDEGGNITAHWDLIYEDTPFDEEDEEDNID